MGFQDSSLNICMSGSVILGASVFEVSWQTDIQTNSRDNHIPTAAVGEGSNEDTQAKASDKKA